jgi:LPXTG-site transpeptidase (sortase) family protein
MSYGISMKKFIITFFILISSLLYTPSQIQALSLPSIHLPFQVVVYHKVGIPLYLTIPKLGITTAIETVGMDTEGAMDVPKDPYHVGWYKLGTKPGEVGRAVLDGHYDTKTGPGAFYTLKKLEVGDTIIITDSTNNEYTFVVKDKKLFSDSDFPISAVFGTDTKAKLNLITCGGVWDTASQVYSKRLVVFTELQQ